VKVRRVNSGGARKFQPAHRRMLHPALCWLGCRSIGRRVAGLPIVRAFIAHHCRRASGLDEALTVVCPYQPAAAFGSASMSLILFPKGCTGSGLVGARWPRIRELPKPAHVNNRLQLATNSARPCEALQLLLPWSSHHHFHRALASRDLPLDGAVGGHSIGKLSLPPGRHPRTGAHVSVRKKKLR
jgi:hypothetical protein